MSAKSNVQTKNAQPQPVAQRVDSSKIIQIPKLPPDHTAFILKVADNIIARGLAAKATEIRILPRIPGKKRGIVQYNTGDGKVRHLMSYSLKKVPAIQSRFKIQGDLSISVHGKAQVGNLIHARLNSIGLSVLVRFVVTIEPVGEVVTIVY